MSADPEFEKLVANRRKWYFSVGSVHCKYLNENVLFNSHGFKHALRDGRGHYRNKADAKMRLNILHWAPVVIRNAAYMPQTERREIDDPRNKLGKPVTFFELQAAVKHQRGKKTRHLEITVILRRIGDGPLHYFSIRYTRNGINKITH